MYQPVYSRRQRGFTLIEAMVTVSIAVILVGVAAPSFTSSVRKFKLNSVSTALSNSLQLARSEAVKSNRRVLVCPQNTAGSDCAASTDWGTNGWLVCYDQNVDGVCDAATTTLPNPIRREGRVDPAFATVTGPSTPLLFNSLGSAAAAGTITVKGTWTGAASIPTNIAASGLIKSTKL